MSLRRAFRILRIVTLLTILFIVGIGTWLTKLRTTDWDSPLWVAVYPIKGDNKNSTNRYLAQIDEATFHTIEEFFIDEGKAWGLDLAKPMLIKIAPEIKVLPPNPPENNDVIKAMLWSLKFRYWAWRNDTFKGPSPDIRMFLVYHSPELHTRLNHSVGLEKGLIGIANVYAKQTQTEQNNVIIAHEILHTLGATDKYDQQNYPVYPEGFAEPEKTPLLPQTYTELMGGRKPVSSEQAVIPKNLHNCLIGRKTAEEINWSG